MSNNNSEFSIYCNGIKVLISPFDFSFEIYNNSSNGTTRMGEIKMSPEHAKIFAQMLTQHIKNYEETFGEIPQIDRRRMMSVHRQGKMKNGR